MIVFMILAVASRWVTVMANHACSPDVFRTLHVEGGPNRDEGARGWKGCHGRGLLRDEGCQLLKYFVSEGFSEEYGKQGESFRTLRVEGEPNRDEGARAWKGCRGRGLLRAEGCQLLKYSVSEGFSEEYGKQGELCWCTPVETMSQQSLVILDDCVNLTEIPDQWNHHCPAQSCLRRVKEDVYCVDEDTDEAWLMQKGKDHKRRRSPTPRRRRIPARGRVHFEPNQRQQRRASWMQRPEQ